MLKLFFFFFFFFFEEFIFSIPFDGFGSYLVL